jgi:AraC-like DNA-binding protein
MQADVALDVPRRVREGFPGQRIIVLPRPVVSAWLGANPLLELLPSDVGHFPHAEGHYVERPAGAPQLVLIYCVQGEGWLRMEQTWRVRPGQALVIPPGAPHAYGADASSPWTIYWIHLAGAKARRAGSLITEGVGSPICQVGLDPALPPLFEEILDLLDRGYASARLFQASACLGQLVAAFAAVAARRGGPGETLDDRVEQVIETMHRQLGDRLGVAELAAEARLSPSYFAAAFKRKTGFAVLDYFLRLKMQRACLLLDSTGLPVKAIAADLGFDDPLYFSRCFHRVHECSPTEYRAARKG